MRRSEGPPRAPAPRRPRPVPGAGHRPRPARAGPASTVALSRRRAPAKARKASGSSAKAAVSEADPQAAGRQRRADVEPGVAAQHGAGEHQQQDQDLPFPPDRPGGRRERREQEHVEVHPDGAPVMRVEVVRQRGGEHHDPAGQDHAAAGRDEQRQPPLPAQPGVAQVRVGQCAGPLGRGASAPSSSASILASCRRSAWLIRRNSASSITTSLCPASLRIICEPPARTGRWCTAGLPAPARPGVSWEK